jgi:DNA-binding Xre family transcriptional regulator
MGMTFQRFDHHIKPKDDLSFNFITKLCEHLNVSVDDFIESVKISKDVAEH